MERDRLTVGQPDQIYALAGTFESAAREAASASEKGARASLTTGEAYRVDGTEVHAVDLETGRTRDLLSGSGDDLDRIAKILRGVGDELGARTRTATGHVTDLEGQLDAVHATFRRFEADYRTARAAAVTPADVTALDAGYQTELGRLRERSKALAEEYGGRIADLGEQYDDMLGAWSRELAASGFEVPGAVNQGPGDVDSDLGAGSRDARTVAEALKLGPGAQRLAEIDAASAQIRALNDKVERGGRLTDAERMYLHQFYETLGTDDLARLPGHLQAAAMNDNVYDGTLAPFRDSIMNLSQGVLDDAGRRSATRSSRISRRSPGCPSPCVLSSTTPTSVSSTRTTAYGSRTTATSRPRTRRRTCGTARATISTAASQAWTGTGRWPS
jgi:hypothetical protein